MTFAQVVPIRRMPTERPWLTYRVPDELHLEVGSFVTIPLRGRPISGIVWSLTHQEPQFARLQDVRAVILPHPLLTSWQIRVVEVMAQTGGVALGDILWGMLPKISAKKYATYFSSPVATVHTKPSSASTVSWYRQRSAAVEEIVRWAIDHPQEQRLILTPTKEDIDRLILACAARGIQAEAVHAEISPTALIELMSRVRAGSPVVIVGTTKALTLPFPAQPMIVFDQEEHHAHKQTSQHPRTDAREIVRLLDLPMLRLTPAPSLLTYRDQHPTPPPPIGNRQIATLDRPGAFTWITTEMETRIETTLQRQQRVAIIAPRRGFASTTNCRACGYALVCPTCGERASIFRGTHDQAHCRHCQSTFSTQLSCPRCQSTDWAFHGLGIERVVELIQQRWPDQSVSPLIHADVDTDIGIDSYVAYHQLHTIEQLGAVIVMSGDSLLNLPDYSTAERAWQYVARLQAEVPTCPLLIQTFNPEQVFWQRWLHSDDRAWYESELAQRHRLALPPFTTQWIVRFRGQPAEFKKKVAQVQHDYQQTVRVETLPPQPGKPQRMLLSFAESFDLEHFPAATLFPTPWQVDKSPSSWLD